ncbi:MAG: UvrD-helicase domain-containing protein [Bacteroidota bacterium]
MKVFQYNELDTHSVKVQFEKVVNFLQKGDFKSADVKKMSDQSGYYRARLDGTNRLLFRFARYQDETCLLLLEVILNHAYEKSKFLRGAMIDETKLQPLLSDTQVPAAETLPLSYVGKNTTHFHLLDKFLFFDNDQQAVLSLPAPLVIIGSAGSGKTALTLEKLKMLPGKVLYVTHSRFLVENATKLYRSFHYENDQQEIDFLSFKEFVETLRIPTGKELTFQPFEAWFIRHRAHTKIKDAHQLFEEFRGVITGYEIDSAYLSREMYLGLGARQSIFQPDEREAVYGLFLKYLEFLQTEGWYDLNMVAHESLAYCEKQYNFAVVDEVQDFTNVQLYLILHSLLKPQNFILCGDSHQVVHPNFFSWAKIKTMFYKHGETGSGIRVLHTNYRNSPQVTELANRLLRIKNLRFGSLDRESTYLVEPVSEQAGEVVFIKDSPVGKQDLNARTRRSAQYAVLVMREEDKAEVRRFFDTPLLFSIHEAKGLEYENIILVNFISRYEKVFREIAGDVTEQDLAEEELHYSRPNRDDKSLEMYKFYINSLYVAVTRTVRSLYVVEQTQKHPLLNLLGLTQAKDKATVQTKESSSEEWQKEASKLELQGKHEQADAIRKQILHQVAPNWTVLQGADLEKLRQDALNPNQFNKKAKDRLFEYSLLNEDTSTIDELAQLKYNPARNSQDSELKALFRRHYPELVTDDVPKASQKVARYGLDYRDEFNYTPLMMAALSGAVKIATYLLENGAQNELRDNAGRNALQIALYHSYLSERYAKEKIGYLYEPLRTESISLKINDRLFKVGNHKMEYLMLNYLLAVQPMVLKKKAAVVGWSPEYIQTDDFLRVFVLYPEKALPAFRKERPYVNSILSKNEINSRQPYNLKLFLRLKQGHYILNPDMEIRVEQEWVNVYELMGISRQQHLRTGGDPAIASFWTRLDRFRKVIS